MMKRYVRVCALIVTIFLLSGGVCRCKDDRAQEPRDVSASDVFSRFKLALEHRSADAFALCAIQISEHKLLTNLSADEIKSSLGPPIRVRRVFVDQQVPQTGNPILRLTAEKCDYWVYSVYDPKNNLQVAIGLAISKGKLIWSFYEKSRSKKTLDTRRVEYE